MEDSLIVLTWWVKKAYGRLLGIIYELYEGPVCGERFVFCLSRLYIYPEYL